VLEHPGGEEFAVAKYELSVRHDLRPLALKTVLTYLELDGVLRRGRRSTRATGCVRSVRRRWRTWSPASTRRARASCAA
jgi:hypothetical protein